MDWKNRFSAIDNKIRQQLFSRKAQNFASLNKYAHEYDQHHSGRMSPTHLNLFLNKAGIFLTTQQLRTIRDKFDYDQNGQICYTDFVNSLKNNMSERVMSVIKQAFDHLDKEGTGYVLIDDIVPQFKPLDHPHTETRTKFPVEICKEFTEGVSSKSSDQKGVSEKQFFDYYAELGTCIPKEREDYFVSLILSTWNLKEGKYHVDEKKLRELEITLYEKIRQRHPNEQNTARTAFKYFDLGDSGFCAVESFARALDKFGCKFLPHEIAALFSKYDTSGDSRLSYNEFCAMLVSIEQPLVVNPLTTLGQNSIGFSQLKI